MLHGARTLTASDTEESQAVQFMKDNKTQQSKTELITRHVHWRRQYRRRRYLEHLKEDALVQRAKDLLASQVTLTDDLKIGFYDFRIDGDYLMMAWTHILEEFALRNYRPPAPFEGRLDDMQIPKYDWPGVQRAIKQIRSISYSEDGALFKYGKEKFSAPDGRNWVYTNHGCSNL